MRCADHSAVALAAKSAQLTHKIEACRCAESRVAPGSLMAGVWASHRRSLEAKRAAVRRIGETYLRITL